MASYYGRLVDAAIDTPDTLGNMGHDDAMAILKELEVLPGHRHRLLQACMNSKDDGPSATSPTKTTAGTRNLSASCDLSAISPSCLSLSCSCVARVCLSCLCCLSLVLSLSLLFVALSSLLALSLLSLLSLSCRLSLSCLSLSHRSLPCLCVHSLCALMSPRVLTHLSVSLLSLSCLSLSLSVPHALARWLCPSLFEICFKVMTTLATNTDD